MSVASDSLFIGQTSQIVKLFQQINSTSRCSTPSCNGRLKMTNLKLKGLGGALDITYDCTGCANRSITYESKQYSEKSVSEISSALVVAFVCAGATYSLYTKVLRNALGVHVLDDYQFYDILTLMYPHVGDILEDICKSSRERMKSMDPSVLGSWNRAVTAGDATWLTCGHHSRNCTFTIRDYITGSLLYYIHLCQRGADKVSTSVIYEGTSKSAEGYGAEVLFERAKKDGMNVECHVQDRDSSSSKSLLKNYPNCELKHCGNHATKNHKEALKRLQQRKCFTKEEINKYSKVIPTITADIKCHCPTKHRSKCGCISDDFIRKAGANFQHCLTKAGTDAEGFSSKLISIATHHARKWGGAENEKCWFHSPKACTCGN